MKKAALLVGGEYGRGFASCRTPGNWSAPAPVRLTGGSLGVQLGADSTDIILLLMSNTVPATARRSCWTRCVLLLPTVLPAPAMG